MKKQLVISGLMTAFVASSVFAADMDNNAPAAQSGVPAAQSGAPADNSAQSQNNSAPAPQTSGTSSSSY